MSTTMTPMQSATVTALTEGMGSLFGEGYGSEVILPVSLAGYLINAAQCEFDTPWACNEGDVAEFLDEQFSRLGDSDREFRDLVMENLDFRVPVNGGDLQCGVDAMVSTLKSELAKAVMGVLVPGDNEPEDSVAARNKGVQDAIELSIRIAHRCAVKTTGEFVKTDLDAGTKPYQVVDEAGDSVVGSATVIPTTAFLGGTDNRMLVGFLRVVSDVASVGPVTVDALAEGFDKVSAPEDSRAMETNLDVAVGINPVLEGLFTAGEVNQMVWDGFVATFLAEFADR